MEPTTVSEKLTTSNEAIAASLANDHPMNDPPATPEAGVDTLLVSPEQIDTRANAETELLHEMLRRAFVADGFRHWGINE